MWLCLILLTLCNILTIVTYGLIIIRLWEFYNTTSHLRKALIILVIFRSKIYCAKKTLCFRCVLYFVRLISFINIIMTPRHILLHGEIQIIMPSILFQNHNSVFRFFLTLCQYFPMHLLLFKSWVNREGKTNGFKQPLLTKKYCSLY